MGIIERVCAGGNKRDMGLEDSNQNSFAKKEKFKNGDPDTQIKGCSLVYRD